MQEHFALAPDQETYSYYGPLNKVSFNVGYHNEHHNLVTVPWSRLPLIRAQCARVTTTPLVVLVVDGETLVRFLTDRNLTLFNYIIRRGGARGSESAAMGSSKPPTVQSAG